MQNDLSRCKKNIYTFIPKPPFLKILKDKLMQNSGFNNKEVHSIIHSFNTIMNENHIKYDMKNCKIK